MLTALIISLVVLAILIAVVGVFVNNAAIIAWPIAGFILLIAVVMLLAWPAPFSDGHLFNSYDGNVEAFEEDEDEDEAEADPIATEDVVPSATPDTRIDALMTQVAQLEKSPTQEPPPAATPDNVDDEPELTPSATPSPTPTIVQQDNALVCKLDKIGTWSEIEGAGRQRIEVGGGGTQHVDYYPSPGIPAVSFIFAPQDPVIWWGHGSIWEGNGPECEDFDYVEDAKVYASDAHIVGRQDSGHSGIVVDTRDGQVYNMGSWSDGKVGRFLADIEEVRTVKDADLSAFNDFVRTNDDGEIVGCTAAEELTDPGTIDITGPAIAQPWWNNGDPSFGQEQVRVKIESGTTVTILDMKGKVYLYEDTPACNANLDNEFAEGDGLTAKSVEDLVSEGLAKQ